MHNEKVVLIEDNPADAELLMYLCREAGYSGTFTWFVDGSEAIDFIQGKIGKDSSDVPDVVMLDLGLPRMNGHEVLQKIRSNQALKDLPVIVFTTSSNPVDIKMAEENGANRYISKPLELSEFEKLAESLAQNGFVKVAA